MDMCFSVCVVTIPVPWGHISGKSWGDEVSKRKILCIHGEYQERAGGWYGILECTRAGALAREQTNGTRGGLEVWRMVWNAQMVWSRG